MKRKTLVLTALVLSLVMALTVTALANPMENVEQRELDGAVYVPLRLTAYALGWEVEWDRDTREAKFIAPDGGYWSINIHELVGMTGGFIEDGTTWIPVEYIPLLFGGGYDFSEFEILTFTLTKEARDIVLYDFDYMVDFILENSPWDSVIFRGLGVDFMEYTALFRAHIESMEPLSIYVLDEAILRTQFPIQEGDDPRALAANYLFALLAVEFAPPLMGIGHLGPRTLDVYIAQLTAFAQEYYRTNPEEYNYFLAHLLKAFTHPSARWFYGEIEIDLYAEGLLLPQDDGNIVTQILVPGEVAFLRVNSFLTDPEYDDLVILPFLQEVSDYDHLIIDLRSNWGGIISYFPQYIFQRLINEPKAVSSHEFFSGGDEATAMMNALLQSAEQQMGAAIGITEILYAAVLPADEFIAERGMVYFDPDDLERLAYVMVSGSLFHPAEDSVGFTGKIWILVDSFSASASVLAAEIAMYTGFATVVGENTSGIMGSSHTYIALPNTGIIWRTDIGYRTDAYGNSLEVYGLAPDIRSFPGMDALETVLALIADGFGLGLGEDA
jgi:hypothetical protein